MGKKNIKGISILESLVCLVVIGIGFIAMLQLSSFSINAMDRSLERNKLNFLSEMVLEDMIGDPDNSSNYGNFNETFKWHLDNEWLGRLAETKSSRLHLIESNAQKRPELQKLVNFSYKGAFSLAY